MNSFDESKIEEQANGLFLEGRLDEAQLLYNQLRSLYPNRIKYDLRLSIIIWYQHKEAESEQILLELIEREPNCADALNNLGVIKLFQKDYKMALYYFNEVSQIQPDYKDINYNLGNTYVGLVDYNQAINAYRSHLEHNPLDKFAYLNLANVLHKEGLHELAITTLKKVIEFDQCFEQAHFNIANIYNNIGNHNLSLRHYRLSIEIDKNFLPARVSLANMLLNIDLAEAETHCDYVLDLDPNNVEMLSLHAQILFLRGLIHESIVAYKSLLRIHPDYIDALINLGVCYLEIGEYDNALDLLKDACIIDPDNRVAQYNLGNAYYAISDTKAAIEAYKHAISLDSHYFDALNNLGNCYCIAHEFSLALEIFNKLCVLYPDSCKAWYNYANTLVQCDSLDKALDALKKAIKISPTYADAVHNLGHIYHLKGDYKNAIANYEQVLRINPGYNDSKLNLALIYLLKGDYKKGFEFFETRFSVKKPISVLCVPEVRLWDGNFPIISNRLLVVSEQGLGDFLQFSRFIKYVKAKGIETKICCRQELHQLIIESHLDPEPILPCDIHKFKQCEWLPIMSLPAKLEVTIDKLLAFENYIFASQSRKDKWHRKLSNERRPLIALNWQGNPDAENGLLRGRSINLQSLEKIAYTSKGSLISLQKGFGSEQLDICSFRDAFVSVQDEITINKELADTAAIISCCDLVITTDTSMAHLAGAIGKRVWVLLKHNPDWRWGVDIKSSHWYRSMRLFRQSKLNDWNSVIDNVCNELIKLF
jgi:tetratricopeptide (TPR) repeat protein